MTEYYNDFSDKCRLTKRPELMSVTGYGHSLSGKVVSEEKRVYTIYKDLFPELETPKTSRELYDFVYHKSAKLLDKIYDLTPDEIIKLKGTLSNKEVRIWYNEANKKIPDQIDKTKSIEEQARQACELRNKNRTAARDAMADPKEREGLDIKYPMKSFEKLLEDKMQDKGLTRDEAIEDILKTATKTNKKVNKKLGLNDE